MTCSSSTTSPNSTSNCCAGCPGTTSSARTTASPNPSPVAKLPTGYPQYNSFINVISAICIGPIQCLYAGCGDAQNQARCFCVVNREPGARRRFECVEFLFGEGEAIRHL